MLWAWPSQFNEWEVPTIVNLTNFEYRAKCRERWKYLIVLLQFWMDNNAAIQIKGSPIWPMSVLAKLVKDTANCVLPLGFHISWKHIIEKTPWYNFQDYQQLSTIVTPCPKQRLEEVKLHYHKKVGQMLKDQQHSCLAHSRSTCQKPPSTPIAPEAPVEGQFNQDDNLGQDPYNLLKTPTDTPIQDESITPVQDNTLGDTTMSNAVTEEENRLLDDEGGQHKHCVIPGEKATSQLHQSDISTRGAIESWRRHQLSPDVPPHFMYARCHTTSHAMYHANSATKGNTANESLTTNTCNTIC